MRTANANGHALGALVVLGAIAAACVPACLGGNGADGSGIQGLGAQDGAGGLPGCTASCTAHADASCAAEAHGHCIANADANCQSHAHDECNAVAVGNCDAQARDAVARACGIDIPPATDPPPAPPDEAASDGSGSGGSGTGGAAPSDSGSSGTGGSAATSDSGSGGSAPSGGTDGSSSSGGDSGSSDPPQMTSPSSSSSSSSDGSSDPPTTSTRAMREIAQMPPAMQTQMLAERAASQAPTDATACVLNAYAHAFSQCSALATAGCQADAFAACQAMATATCEATVKAACKASSHAECVAHCSSLDVQRSSSDTLLDRNDIRSARDLRQNDRTNDNSAGSTLRDIEH